MPRSTVFFVLALLAVAAGALAFRLPRLDQRPMHGDEANQAVRAGILLDTGIYRYDLAEHHGPSLYWITRPWLKLRAGDFAHTDEFMFRIVPVLFGAGLILLVFLVGDALGRPAAVLGALLAAVSPAMVYYSRYYIQETLLVFFTLATIGCAWRWVRWRSIGWAVAAGASLGLMHATKETWILAGAAVAIGLVLTAAWTRWIDQVPAASRAAPEPVAQVASDASGGAAPGPARRAGPTLVAVLAAVAAVALVAVALYSSFGANPSGPGDSILAYEVYLQRGAEGGIHAHPWYQYFEWLFAFRPRRGFFWTEGLIAGLALVGAVAALWPTTVRHGPPASARRGSVASARRGSPDPAEGADRRVSSESAEPSAAPRFLRFLTFYTGALTAIYCAVTYKTPWCALGFLHGMILLAGVGAWTLLRRAPTWPLKVLVALALLAGGVHLARQSYALNYRFYADQRNPYVYAHTSQDAVELGKLMERLAAVSPDGHEMIIHVVASENIWPLPWYLRRFHQDHVGYWSDAGDWSAAAERCPPPSVIILTPDFQPAVDARLRAAYNQNIHYGLRPGMLVVVYVRQDLWQAFAASVEQAR